MTRTSAQQRVTARDNSVTSPPFFWVSDSVACPFVHFEEVRPWIRS